MVGFKTFSFITTALATFFFSSTANAVAVNSSIGTGTLTPALKSCLAATGVQLSYPSNITWVFDSHGVHSPRVRNPVAVAYPLTTAEASKVVVCAVSNNVRPDPRGGGHNYEQFSAENGQLVIDLSLINEVTVFPSEKYAIVGGGARLGQIYLETAKYNLSFSGGTCGSVGIGGHTQGGGMGVTSRTHGMAADNVLEVTLVDWRGQIYIANSTHHTDLFWAVRGGGGGNWGVITHFKVNLFDGSKVTSVIVNWNSYTTDDLKNTIKAFIAWEPWNNLTPNMSIQWNVQKSGMSANGLYFGDDGPAGIKAILAASGWLNFGNVSVIAFEDDILWARAQEQNHSNLDALSQYQKAQWDLAAFDPSYLSFTSLPNYNVSQTGPHTVPNPNYMPDVPLQVEGRSYFKFSGQEFNRSFDDFAVEQLYEYVNGTYSNTNWFFVLFQFEVYGGNVGALPIDFDAYPWRKNLFHLQYLTINPFALYNNATDQLAALEKALEPYAAGFYMNYPGLEYGTDPAVYIPGYFGTHAERLSQIKTKYDPYGWFHNEQGLIPFFYPSDAAFAVTEPSDG